mmetsp:Transcript_2623/g.5856  ORF Transcript_2623/g.5856 Transcript_2623/m.5856 type:complete len:391 (-) Transcript_2623:1334-2506(-)
MVVTVIIIMCTVLFSTPAVVSAKGRGGVIIVSSHERLEGTLVLFVCLAWALPGEDKSSRLGLLRLRHHGHVDVPQLRRGSRVLAHRQLHLQGERLEVVLQQAVVIVVHVLERPRARDDLPAVLLVLARHLVVGEEAAHEHEHHDDDKAQRGVHHAGASHVQLEAVDVRPVAELPARLEARGRHGAVGLKAQRQPGAGADHVAHRILPHVLQPLRVVRAREPPQHEIGGVRLRAVEFRVKREQVVVAVLDVEAREGHHDKLARRRDDHEVAAAVVVVLRAGAAAVRERPGGHRRRRGVDDHRAAAGAAARAVARPTAVHAGLVAVHDGVEAGVLVSLGAVHLLLGGLAVGCREPGVVHAAVRGELDDKRVPALDHQGARQIGVQISRHGFD